MSGKTNIPWATDVWNPGFGCSKVSAGCANCYAEVMARRLAGKGIGHYRDVISDGRWTGQTRFDHELLRIPYHWKKSRRIFAFSMSDLFHDYYRDDEIDAVLNAMEETNHHRYVLLTKRPNRVLAGRWDFPNNCAIGVSVEDQKTFDERLHWLSMIRAATRIVSIEPMIGPIKMTKTKHGWLDWVILGGESGPRARPMYRTWATAIKTFCWHCRIPFYFKQWGTWIPEIYALIDSPINLIGEKRCRKIWSTNRRGQKVYTRYIRVGKNVRDSKTLNHYRFQQYPEGLLIDGK